MDRINTTLKNLGFAYFDRNFVDNLTGDSTGTKVNIYLNILNPKNQTEHKIYRYWKDYGKSQIYPLGNFKAKKETRLLTGFDFGLDEYGTVVNPKSIIQGVVFKRRGIVQRGKLY